MGKKWLQRLFGVILLLFIIYGGFVIWANPVSSPKFFRYADTKPLVIAHQGGDDLWPGDTLYAFERSVELGVDVLEMDVHSTNDGVLVLIHDSTVDRTTNGVGAVNSFTLGELQKLDAGYDWSRDEGATYPYRDQGIAIPTLKDVFEAFPDIRMNIEIKQDTPSITRPFCEIIREYGMQEKVLVASFKPNALEEFRENCPEVATSSHEDEVRTFVYLNLAFLGDTFKPGFSAVQVPEESSGITILTQRFVNVAHRKGLEVHVWTVDEIDDMKRMIDLGLDGIITDRPDRLMQLLGR